MVAYLIRRILYSILVVFGVLFVVFAVARLSPVDPVKYILQQSGRNVGDVNPVEYANLRHQLGLDKPIPVQFVTYIGQVLLSVRCCMGISARASSIAGGVSRTSWGGASRSRCNWR